MLKSTTNPTEDTAKSLTPSTRWSFPTALRIGAGCVAELFVVCAHHGIERPLIVTDPGTVELSAFDALQASFAVTVPVFSAIQPNPVGSNIEAGIEAFRSGNHDGVVAFGGGSALDVPDRLVDLGVDSTQVASIAEAAAVDPSAGGNPIPFTAALAAEVFTRACNGHREGSR